MELGLGSLQLWSYNSIITNKMTKRTKFSNFIEVKTLALQPIKSLFPY